MIVNLIYDMRNGITDWMDDYTDEQRGDAVLTVLRSSRNKVEFGKIVKELKIPENGNRESVLINDLILDNQQSVYQEIILEKSI